MRTFLTLLPMGLLFFSIGCGKPEGGLDDAATSLVEAKHAIADGDESKAMELLNSSLEARPDPWAYLERAQLHAENGDDVAAKADVEAGLELDEEHADLLWFEKQLNRPKSSRGKGKTAEPPSMSK